MAVPANVVLRCISLAAERLILLKDVLDESENAQDEGGENDDGQPKRKGKEAPSPPAKKAKHYGSGGAGSTGGPRGERLMKARESSDAEKGLRKLVVGEEALLMACKEDWNMDDEEARWALGTPKDPTMWYTVLGTPTSHLPLLTGFVIETKEGASVKHFGQKLKLPREYMAIKVRFVQYIAILCPYLS